MLTEVDVDARGRAASLLNGRESKKRRWEQSARGQQHVALESKVATLMDEIGQLKAGLLEARQTNSQLMTQLEQHEGME